MHHTNIMNILAVAGMLAWSTMATAVDMDHSTMDHSKMDHSAMQPPPAAYVVKPGAGELPILKEQPASGKAREAGADGRYVMESTTVRNAQTTQCAQASRGLIMLDNASWRRCGGKPKGVASNPARAAAQEHSGMH